MKKLKLWRFPLIIISIISCAALFQNCEKEDDDDHECDLPTYECDSCDNTIVRKPNIYIYPQENIQLAVNIDFPAGGEVITSIPEYGNGWNVSVDANGIINENYTFLFYESKQPDVWQNDAGWTVNKQELTTFFKENMASHGFYGQEIQDFIEYWIPILNDSPYYYIYPQTSDIIEKVIKLRFSKEPDNLLRFFYVIKRSDTPPKNELIEPETANKFERNGFFITEWGVVFD